MRRVDPRNHTSNPKRTENPCRGSYELGTACNACRRCCNELLVFKTSMEERGLIETEQLYKKLLPIMEEINESNKTMQSHGVELSKAEKKLVKFVESLNKKR